MSTIERAVEIATAAHAGQVDKAGAPYIAHPLRVMAAAPLGDAQIVAILHDVIEDTDWTLDQLRDEGFSDGVLAGIDAVTRRDGETYAQFVERAARDPLGRIVKRADLMDNLDETRLARRQTNDGAASRRDRYIKALAGLDGGTDPLGN